MSITHVVGIDPGIVHTGVVSLVFNPARRFLAVRHAVVLGDDATRVEQQIKHGMLPSGTPLVEAHIFIEGYRSRHHLQHDSRMIKAVANMKAATGGKVLDNTGVKKIILLPVMRVLKVEKFSTPTHHQDLQSAARIALLGMYKDPELNTLVADVIRGHIDSTNTWSVDQF